MTASMLWPLRLALSRRFGGGRILAAQQVKPLFDREGDQSVKLGIFLKLLSCPKLWCIRDGLTGRPQQVVVNRELVHAGVFPPQLTPPGVHQFSQIDTW